MADRIVTASPRVMARLAGALYGISAVPAGFSVYVLLKLVVRGDPAATATNILGAEGLFRLGFVADLVGILFFVGAMLFLYELFKPVNRSLALLLLLFSLIGSAIQALDSLGDIATLLFLKGGTSLAAMTADQAQALALLFLRLHTLTYDLALVFFGSSFVLMGCLILRSTFLPRIFGVLIAIDGAGYLTFSLATFLSPAFAAHLYPYLPFLTAFLGEPPLMLWLLIKAVNAERWAAQAAAGVASSCYPGGAMGKAVLVLFLTLTPMHPTFAAEGIPDAAAQEARNRVIAGRVFEEIFNQGKFRVADDIYARDFVNHGIHRNISLVEDQAAVHAEKRAFPDLRMTVDLMVAKGDLVTVVWTFRGTHTAFGYGLPPTGARIELRGITVWRIVDGRIREEWTSYDQLRPIRQVVKHLRWLLIALLAVAMVLGWMCVRTIRRLWPRGQASIRPR